MITGLKALEELHIPVKASQPFSGRSLNNTLTVLNRFALIERNEQELNVQSSQSSQRSREMLADNIDVIRIQGVVQGFFADSLHADKSLNTYFKWIDAAVRLFCCSYDTAIVQISRKTNMGLVEDYRLYEIHGIRLRDHCMKHEKKLPLAGIRALLDSRLALMKQEIDRRTHESSNFIASGGENAPQTSIFDRSSSSSDTNPETPGDSDKTTGISNSPNWGFNSNQEHHSPVDIMDQNQIPSPWLSQTFPPHVPDDRGYESDREDTAMPSPRTVRPPSSPNSQGGEWHQVARRRPHTSRYPLGDHRTTRNMPKYSDRAGSFRTTEPVDPRARARPQVTVTRQTAHGYVQNTSTRVPSRGRSSQSNARAALAHISATSPPPAMATSSSRDRRSSNEQRRLLSGAPSYATAVSGYVRDAVFRDARRPGAEHPPSSPDQEPVSIQSESHRTAIQSLQHLPGSPSMRSPNQPLPYTPMPPYPQSPGHEYESRYLGSDANNMHRETEQYNQENRDPSSNVYPQLTGPVPREKVDASFPGRRRNSAQGYDGEGPQSNSDILESSAHEARNPPFLSLSSRNTRSAENTYYPGYPEFSGPQDDTIDRGYTSQPMSKDPSSQSTPSNQTQYSAQPPYPADWQRRRPSIAETEPAPMLPEFSPQIEPTSYEVYERTRGIRQERIATRKGSRIEVSRVSERLEEWTVTTESEK